VEQSMSPSVSCQEQTGGVYNHSDSRSHAIARRLRSAAHRYVLAWLPRTYPASDRPVTVMVPMAEKDLTLAPRCIAHLKQNLRHPITRIVVPGQKSKALADFCRDNGYVYIDENDVLPECIKSLAYVADGRNRNGWIRQQALKLGAFGFVDDELVFACDSDTLFLRPFAMLQGERQVLFEADEYIDSYHEMSMRLLGPHQRYRWSFVAHCMLFQRDVMTSLLNDIEARHRMPWPDAIVSCLDRTVGPGLSEFELYGNYLHCRFPDRFVGKYWYNCKLRLRRDGASVDAGSVRRFNSVSDHVGA
jgi:hypothetical protein